uniref:LIM zinc-binding domain-containing protein n=1 Tax=Neolamprologus brichardi TaxID=32507 RepID=A0A3Q4GUV4_NEOBR
MQFCCPHCDAKVSSLGKDWHKLCLKCDRCNKLLNAGGHAEHDGRPYCHKPCYAALFGPKGVNIGGAGSYVYDTPANNNVSPTSVDSASKAEEKRAYAPKAPSKAGSITTFSGEANLCPRCNKKVYFAEKVTSLGKDWHRPCLRCERCSKTLAAGSHAEHDGQPYCHKPCYAVLFGPKGNPTLEAECLSCTCCTFQLFHHKFVCFTEASSTPRLKIQEMRRNLSCSCRSFASPS